MGDNQIYNLHSAALPSWPFELADSVLRRFEVSGMASVDEAALIRPGCAAALMLVFSWPGCGYARLLSGFAKSRTKSTFCWFFPKLTPGSFA